MSSVIVMDLGGSIVAPDNVDTHFLKEFKNFMESWLEENRDKKVIMVIGGGGAARKYQQACSSILPQADSETLDWLGIRATRLNAQLLKSVFGALAPAEIVTDPYAPRKIEGRIMVACGWKPGFSTDYDAVILAERFGASTVLNLSNLAQVYTADPRKDASATPLEHISWEEYKKMAGDNWIPGNNVPFDPVATQRAAQLNLRVVFAHGKDLENLEKLLTHQKFTGTVMGPLDRD